ncbi:MAG: hypothetical protein ABFD07_18220 [Methanobacterium sp.]
MGCDDLAIVYINPHSGLPVWINGQENIDDINILAKLYVPEGVIYNIINKSDMYNQPLPAPAIEVEEEDLSNIFYTYLNAL